MLNYTNEVFRTVDTLTTALWAKLGGQGVVIFKTLNKKNTFYLIVF